MIRCVKLCDAITAACESAHTSREHEGMSCARSQWMARSRTAPSATLQLYSRGGPPSATPRPLTRRRACHRRRRSCCQPRRSVPCSPISWVLWHCTLAGRAMQHYGLLLLCPKRQLCRDVQVVHDTWDHGNQADCLSDSMVMKIRASCVTRRRSAGRKRCCAGAATARTTGLGPCGGPCPARRRRPL